MPTSRKQLAKVIPITSKLAPKACEWRIGYVHYSAAGEKHYECLVFNYDIGLTAFEAWQVSCFPGNPPFYECTFEQLCGYPCPEIKTELKIHGKPHRTDHPKSKRISAVLIGQDNRTTPEIPRPA